MGEAERDGADVIRVAWAGVSVATMIKSKSKDVSFALAKAFSAAGIIKSLVR